MARRLLSIAVLATTTVAAACGGAAPSQVQAPAPSAAAASGPAPRASAGAAPSGQAAAVPVKLALGTYLMTWVPLWVAQDTGIFKRHGLDVQFVKFATSGPANAALESGAAQFSVVDATLPMNLIQHGVAVQAVAQLDTGASTDVMAVRTNILRRLHVSESTPLAARMRALKGQTLGVGAPGGTIDDLTRELVQKGGLTPGKDVTLLPFRGGGAGLVGVMQEGKIAGFMWGPPYPEETVRLGFGTVLVNAIRGEVPEWKGATGHIVIATKAYVAAHPDVVKRMQAAMVEADDYCLAHPNQAAAVVAKRFANKNVPASLVDSVVKQIIPNVARNAQMTEAGWLKAEHLYQLTGQLHQKLDMSQGALWINPKLAAS